MVAAGVTVVAALFSPFSVLSTLSRRAFSSSRRSPSLAERGREDVEECARKKRASPDL